VISPLTDSASGSWVLLIVRRPVVVPAVGYWRRGLSAIVAFWFAYVVTRPLGASIADWLSKPARHGRVGLGDGPVAACYSSPSSLPSPRKIGSRHP
jgi:uncharacterized membrane-anchored protein